MLGAVERALGVGGDLANGLRLGVTLATLQLDHRFLNDLGVFQEVVLHDCLNGGLVRGVLRGNGRQRRKPEDRGGSGHAEGPEGERGDHGRPFLVSGLMPAGLVALARITVSCPAWIRKCPEPLDRQANPPGEEASPDGRNGGHPHVALR